MATMNEMKQQQRDEEMDTLGALVHSKLETAWLELDLIRRSVRLSDEDSGELVLTEFFEFAANKAIETRQTREEFLLAMGELYDQEREAVGDDFDLDDEVPIAPGKLTDKGATGGGPTLTVVE